ncbi:hypothetical protein [Marinobacterium iners]|uniref:Uncharacterized protein n=1 Tax=Marinobacterium iners DSM 11526 TaxID=1122198 RepID=A0A1H3X464_9GAMM|nr:hypothetical protein [Marinobacterium iners]SDZ94199.1 hypothetical protein SAMN02745729_10136 [Marinobacterium iners DSM 11526]
MAAIQISAFNSALPGITPRRIQPGFAQYARNADTSLQSLQAMKGLRDSGITTGRTNPKTVYKYANGQWLAFADEVDVVRSPIIDDAWERIYWCGGGYAHPMMASISTATAGSMPYPRSGLRLGVPAPESPPAATPDSDRGEEPITAVTAVYVFTFVTAYDEEGPPSPPSNPVVRWDADDEGSVGGVLVTIPGGLTAATDIRTIRIYRAESGSFQYVADVPYGSTSYIDNILSAELGIACPSIDWDPPAENMSGIGYSPGGALYGFYDNVLTFSEAGRPHAWPIGYRLSLQDDIVAVAETTAGLLVTTKGAPVIVTGSSPSAMSAVRIDDNRACVSKRSMVDMGEFAIYASPDGLVAVSSSGAQLITSKVFSEKEWQALNPATIHAYRVGASYVAFYDNGTPGSFVFSPERGVTFCSEYAHGGYYDRHTDTLCVSLGSTLKEWDKGAQAAYLWRSGIFEVQTGRTGFTCGKVIADGPTMLRLIGDGQTAFEYTVPNGSMFRLPAGYNRVREWQIELEGTAEVFSVQIAQSPEELV